MYRPRQEVVCGSRSRHGKGRVGAGERGQECTMWAEESRRGSRMEKPISGARRSKRIFAAATGGHAALFKRARPVEMSMGFRARLPPSPVRLFTGADG